MGRNDNRVSPKMRRRKSKQKSKAREKRVRAEKFKARTGRDVPASKLTA